MVKQLETWYINKYRDKWSLSDWRKKVNDKESDMPFILLTGEMNLESISIDNHVRYLWRFNRSETISTVLSRIDSAKLWIKPTDSVFNNFEDVFHYVCDKINTPKIPYVGQLAIYDISLHLVWLWNDEKLQPNSYVYLHALPQSAYSRLVKEGLINKLKLKKGRICMTEFKRYFPNLRADEIEDMFCLVGKSIRKIDKKKDVVSITNIIKYG